mmetsp:Transcript_33597/g.24262  ORF Transcript_33597/g.24262 Transcript_33597/m.24262 type:complete len:268 (+) Transcript_33597:30-833(+)|eukprot:CAMPEP_0116879236 /NCGR_PEP_ID=MMETSP0463-20121206/11033_1 /TAXON_ID=181622 /ORGANISM="Strombidinopsis sp, Strain SopsisLIS2011" /LENGTH=267 /DNA_ID=CAMNT_0004528349 /DNA_START=22 /DNA_END=825 /DNA_ORIENTATION=+
MLGQSMFTRRLMASRSQITKLTQRQFSLLVPLQTKADAPAEVQHTPITDAYYAEMTKMHTEYNESCQSQLKEMNQNLITNIIQRGGNDGWEVQEDLTNMTKRFDFKSFEQAQQFCQHVSKFCNEKDHHPEWSLENNGKTVKVLLTSHFAGNKITRLDFEVAEAMNNSYYIVDRSFKMFPYYSEKQWSSFTIGFGSLLVGSFIFAFMTSHPYPRRFRHVEQIVVEPLTSFNVDTKELKNNEDVHQYVKDNVDKYAYAKMQRSQQNGIL